MKYSLRHNNSYPYFRSFYGGKPIIGKGISGIVLKPDIKHHNDNYISKLFILPEDTTIEEFEELETVLNTLDHENKYHIPIIDIQTINSSHNLDELEYNDRKKYTYLATYQYGGLSLDNLLMDPKYNSIITPLFCKQICNGFLNLFEGIMFLSQHEINHNDIHSGNIVFIFENPTMMRFIDFNYVSPLRISKRYVQDVIDLLHVIQYTVQKFVEVAIERANRPFFDYLQSILIIIDRSIVILFRNYDINDIVIVKQTLKEKIDEIEPFVT